MSKLWQLKKLSTNEALNEPQVLPENWGPIFGLHGIKEKLGDLSWLGEQYADQGWFIVGDAPDGPKESSIAELLWERAKKDLKESDWAVLSDVPMTVGKRQEWIEYRQALREIRLQSGFPNDVVWPKIPD